MSATEWEEGMMVHLPFIFQMADILSKTNSLPGSSIIIHVTFLVLPAMLAALKNAGQYNGNFIYVDVYINLGKKTPVYQILLLGAF